MRKVLRKIKENPFINTLVRILLIYPLKPFESLRLAAIKRWPPSGVLNCVFGKYRFKLYSKCDDGNATCFFYNLPYSEAADLYLFSELAKGSNTIFDIGANTGLFSVLASKANPKAAITAFEPYSANAERMKVNVNLNEAKNIFISQLAIGETDGEIEISVPKNGGITDVSSVNKDFSKQMYPELQWNTQRVGIRSLDSIVKEMNLSVDLIKCDVETFEMSVFKGAHKVLEECRPTIIFECFLDDERKTFFNNILATYNYYLYLIEKQEVVHSKEGFVQKAHGLNYLITPVKPVRESIRYSETDALRKELLLHP